MGNSNSLRKVKGPKEPAIPNMEGSRTRKRQSENQIQAGQNKKFQAASAKRSSFENPFESLPTELIQKIFSYIPTENMIAYVSKVSRTFYNISKVGDLNVKITSKMDPTKVTEFVKERCDKITKLSLCGATFKMLDSLTPCLACLTRLDSVEIVGLGSRFPAGFLSSLYAKDSLRQVIFYQTKFP